MNCLSRVVPSFCVGFAIVDPRKYAPVPRNSHNLIHIMDLSLPAINLDKYKSASQRARVGTESWGLLNFYCSSCESPRLDQTSRNTAAIDFICLKCDSTFQLKSQSKP